MSDNRYEQGMARPEIDIGARVIANQELPEGLKPGAKGIVVG